MRIWIRSCHDRYYVAVYPIRHPKVFVDVGINICRQHMTRLLRNSGKRLPRHGTDEVVTVELTAR